MSDINERMQKALDSLKNNFMTLRTGRANTDILNRVMVEAYGSQMPINQVATMHIQDSNVIVVTPFDKSTLGAIERGIVKADIGLNPNNDGMNVRLMIPPLTQERRKVLDKAAKKMAEESRVVVRNTRRDFMDKIKKNEDLSDDEKKREENGVQTVTDKFIKKADELLNHKEQEIMEI